LSLAPPLLYYLHGQIGTPSIARSRPEKGTEK
jgi:hypothetical protein